MFESVRWASAFPVTEAPVVQRALAELERVFGPDQLPEAAQLVRTAVLEPLRKDLLEGGKPELLADFVVQKGDKSKSKDEMYVIALGERWYPVSSRDLGGGARALFAFEPLPAGAVDLDAIDKSKPIESLFGDHAKDAHRIRLERPGLAAPKLWWDAEKSELPEPFAMAVWDAISSTIHRARIAADRIAAPEQTFVSSSNGSGSRDVGRQPGRLLDLLSGDRARIAGPTPFAGQDVLYADSWLGRGVFVTSHGDQRGPVHVWIKDGNGFFRVPGPAHDELPRRGVAPVLDGNELHLFGGLEGPPRYTEVTVAVEGQERKVPAFEPVFSSAHWILDLAKSHRNDPGLRRPAWSAGLALGEGAAWPTALVFDRRPIVAGGVQNYFVREGSARREPIHRLTMSVGARGRWDAAQALPADFTGGHALVDAQGFFIGPGNRMDGRVVYFDMEAGGAFRALPSIPGRLGGGQLARQGNLLFYFAGFVSDPKGELQNSNRIFTLDLDGLDARWKEAGSSKILEGDARIFLQGDRWMALTARGEALAHLD